MRFLCCHDSFMIIRPIFVVLQIGKSVVKSVERQICHSTENMSKGPFLRPEIVQAATLKALKLK